MSDGSTKSGPPAYGAGFLPAVYQGTVFRGGESPILYLRNPPTASPTKRSARRSTSSTRSTGFMNRRAPGRLHARRPHRLLRACLAHAELRARSRGHQRRNPTPPRSSTVSAKPPPTISAASACWRAVWSSAASASSSSIPAPTSGEDWDDAHTDLIGSHTRMAGKIDKPIAGLAAGSEGRGLLDSTLVVWGGEFGRTPLSPGPERPRPSPLRLHHVDGGRRREGRPGAGRHRRVRRPGCRICAWMRTT